MKQILFRIAPLAAAASLLPSLSSPSLDVRVGDLPEYTFERPPLFGFGVDSLDDLRGRPVCVEFFGHKIYGHEDHMKTMLALQEEFGDDLVVLFVEQQGLTEDELLAQGIAQKWLGGRAMWTTEAPFEGGGERLPHFVLIGHDGRVILEGTTRKGEMDIDYPNPVMEDLEDSVAEQVELLRKGPGHDVPGPLRKLWSDFHKGSCGGALEAAREFAKSSTGVEAIAANDAVTSFEARLSGRVARVAWLADNGHLQRAEAELEALEAALEGTSEHAERVAAVAGALASDDLAAERDADAALAKVEKVLYSKGPGSGTARALAKLAEQHSGTKRGAESGRLAKILESSED